MTIPSRHSQVLDAFEAATYGADAITFDLFDTVLLRTFIRPVDLFAAMGDDLAHTAPVAAKAFRFERVRAEERARARARRKGLAEVSLEQIYDEMPKRLIDDFASHDVDVPTLMRKETALELASCFPDEAVVASFRRVVSRAAPVVILSDMYLPLDDIERMVDRIGLSGHAFVQLSSATGVCKADGSAWPLVRKQLGLGLEARIVHLGDNDVSDGLVARAAGIDAYVLPAGVERREAHRLAANPDWFIGSCEALHLRAMRAGVKASTGNRAADQYWSRIAYLAVLPTAIGFAKFVKDQQTTRPGVRPFFLARDGLIFKAVYDALFAVPEIATSAYVWASRRCLNYASVKQLDERDLDFLVSGGEPLSPRQALERVGLDPNDSAIRIVVSAQFPDEEVQLPPGKRDPLRQMFQNLRSHVLARAASERVALLQHLDEVGLFGGPALVVDLGWHGSLQRSLIRLAHNGGHVGSTIDGAYLGTMAGTPGNIDGARLSGWLFEGGKPVQHATTTVGLSVELIELIFSAPHAGILCIETIAGKSRPVRTDDPQEAPRLAVAALIHAEVAEAARTLAPLVSLLDSDRLRDVAIKQLATLLQYPDGEDIAQAGKMTHAEGFGVASYVRFLPTIPRLSDLRRLISNYHRSLWRLAFRAALPRHQRLLLDVLRVAAIGRRSTTRAFHLFGRR